MPEWPELTDSAETVAQRVLGSLLVREFDEGRAVLRIVETEAYDQTDAASHSYRDRTPRTDVMFGPPGFLYVYFTYGMHYCMNIVTGPEGHGSAVLIRAAQPIEGRELLEQFRPGHRGIDLTNGPAKLCQALGINRDWNGHDLHRQPFKLELQPPVMVTETVKTTRIGITNAKEKPWRFYLQGNAYVSKL